MKFNSKEELMALMDSLTTRCDESPATLNDRAWALMFAWGSLAADALNAVKTDPAAFADEQANLCQMLTAMRDMINGWQAVNPQLGSVGKCGNRAAFIALIENERALKRVAD
jgi:hypothetical protein